MANEIIAEYVHWRDTCDGKQFVIMWSDHTWETIRCPFTDYWIGKKSYKQYMDLNKVVSGKMSKEEAINSGAECMFIEKYPDIVTVYSIGDISHELCGGPHVKNTSELGHFKIVKEEASSSGVRRIKAILE